MAVYGLGRPMLRGLGVAEEDRLSEVVWSVSLGLVTAGLLILGLGLAGVLYAHVIGMLTMAACFGGLGGILCRQLRGAERKAFPLDGGLLEGGRPAVEEPDEAPWAPPPRWLSRGMLLAAAVACLGSLIGALAPPTAGDALCYHLELPKTFLLEHRIGYLPYHDNATFPLLAEMWYLWGLALDGAVCAQLVHWGLGILLGLATVVLATGILGRGWAWIAGALVVLTPGINNQMTAPLNDVALAAMTTLTLAAWWQGVAGEGSRRWFVVAGITAGGALGTKYLALVFAAAVAATWLWAIVRRRGQRRFLLQAAAVVAVVAVSVGGVWYTRAAWYRANPVFPMLAEVFPGGDPDDGRTAVVGTRGTLPQSKSPLGRNPLGLASAPWQITMHPERFGGRGHQLGVLLLAALPGLLFSRRLRGLGTLLAVALGYGVLWYLLRQNVRFLFPAVPLLGVAVVWVWIEMRRFPEWPRWIAAATFAVALLAMAAVPLARSRDQLAVAVGWQDRKAYLVRHEPTYRAAVVADALLDRDAHLLSQDYRGFYFNCRVTRENIYRRYTGYDQRITDPVCFSRQLRDAGFTHLLLAEAVGGKGIRYDPTLSRLADAQLSSEAARDLFKLTDYQYHDTDGTVRRYRLVMLREAAAATE